MSKKIFLHALLLVSSFNLYGPENTWAMEEDTPHGYKRTQTEAQLTPQDQLSKRKRTEATPLLGPHDPMELREVEMEISDVETTLVNVDPNDPMEIGDVETALANLYSFDDLPSEVVLHEIIGPMDVEKDRTVLFAFMKTCAKFNGIVVEKYSRVNKIQRHFPWEAQPDLYATTVYFTGTRLRGLLGLGANLASEELITKVLEEDETHFELADNRRFSKGLDKFLNTKVFPEGTFINAFIKYLRLSEQSRTATPQLPIENVLEAARRNLDDRFNLIIQGIAAQGNSDRVQNEFILYVYCIHFHTPNHERKSEYLKALQTDPTYIQITCSLKDMFNPQLLSLKATPGLDCTSGFADIWNSIIDLDPGVSLYQLLQAVKAQGGDIRYAPRSVKYYEMIFKALMQGEQEPTANDLGDAGLAYLAVDNCAKAAENFDEAIEVLEQSGQKPDELNYENAMDAHLGAGNYEDAAYYSDKYLKAVARQQRPSSECYGKAAYAHFRAGYYVQAADYRDKQLQAIPQSGRRPAPVDFKNAAIAHYHAENYPKAAEYLETFLTLAKKSKQPIPLRIYRNIVDLFTRAGNTEKATHYQSFLEKPSEAMDLSE